MRTLTRLRLPLATAVLALAGTAGGLAPAVPAPASGASVAASAGTTAECQQQPVATYSRQAAAVFVGTVVSSTAATLADGRTGRSYTSTVEVSTVYDGRITEPEVTVVSERVRRQCSLGALAPGTTYVFFVQGQGTTWTAAGGSGTASASAQLVAQVTRLLGSGRAPVAPEQESATFTDLEAPAPTRLSRVAAPGAALVIIGLLGLLVAGRLARRT